MIQSLTPSKNISEKHYGYSKISKGRGYHQEELNNKKYIIIDDDINDNE